MSRNRRPPAALALIALVPLSSAGCGSSALAETGTGGANNPAANAQKAVNFAECMRSNGVSQFPDPNTSGKLTIDELAN
jgi:hypothetical protein